MTEVVIGSAGDRLVVRADGPEPVVRSVVAGEARHEYRHVQLRVTLRSRGPGWGHDGWLATADLTVDPGEELARAAADLRELLSRSGESSDFR